MNENTIPVRADLRSRSLDFLRYPLAMAVLVVHLCNEHSEAMQYAPLLRRATSSFIGGQSVPIYFFIAGYVFFLNTDLGKKEYRRKLRNRFHSLLVPYLSWNLLAYAVATLACGDGTAGAGSFFAGLGKALAGSTGGEVSYPADIPMWFVRALIVMAIISPLIKWLLSRAGVWWVVLAGIVWANPYTRYISSWQLASATFFFSWGAWMSLNRRDMMAEFRRMRTPSLVLYLTAATTCYVCYDSYSLVFAACKIVAIVAGLPVAYNAAAGCVAKGLFAGLARLAPAAFFVYCSHMILLRPAADFMCRLLHPHDAATAVAFYALTGFATAALSTCAFFAMRRYTPRLLAPLTGGRL